MIGMVELVSEIDKALYNPVWEQVRKPAPWDKPGENWQARALAQMAEEAAALAADPVKAEEARRAAKSLQCARASISAAIEDAIRAAWSDHGRGRASEKTNASGGCGACSIRIEEILAKGDIVGVRGTAHSVAAE